MSFPFTASNAQLRGVEWRIDALDPHDVLTSIEWGLEGAALWLVVAGDTSVDDGPVTAPLSSPRP